MWHYFGFTFFFSPRFFCVSHTRNKLEKNSCFCLFVLFPTVKKFFGPLLPAKPHMARYTLVIIQFIIALLSWHIQCTCLYTYVYVFFPSFADRATIIFLSFWKKGNLKNKRTKQSKPKVMYWVWNENKSRSLKPLAYP